MLTFEYIINKIININSEFNYCNHNINDNINTIYKIHFTTMISYVNTFNSIKGKYMYLNNFLNNIFYTETIKEEFFDYFNKIQKINMALNKFAFLYKYKKAKIVVNTDMELNNITINSKNIMCVYQLNCKYLFNIRDLLKIINTSLTNSDMFFSNPIPIKNPYNNIFFNKSMLYNIYFFVKFNTNIYSELLFKFFKLNFNLKLFMYKYEYLLREYSIQNFVNNSPSNILYLEILNMIDEYNLQFTDSKYHIHIDKEFPKDTLIKIMKPYLLLSHTSKYSLIPTDKFDSSFILNIKLKSFQKYNPLFGRKIVVLNSTCLSNSKKNKKYIFKDSHISFYPKNNNFLIDHIEYNNVDIYYDNNGFEPNGFNPNNEFDQNNGVDQNNEMNEANDI